MMIVPTKIYFNTQRRIRYYIFNGFSFIKCILSFRILYSICSRVTSVFLPNITTAESAGRHPPNLSINLLLVTLRIKAGRFILLRCNYASLFSITAATFFAVFSISSISIPSVITLIKGSVPEGLTTILPLSARTDFASSIAFLMSLSV